LEPKPELPKAEEGRRKCDGEGTGDRESDTDGDIDRETDADGDIDCESDADSDIDRGAVTQEVASICSSTRLAVNVEN
jgi:hypothetical protein